MSNKLILLSNSLDEIGLYAEADQVDLLIKQAGPLDWIEENIVEPTVDTAVDTAKATGRFVEDQANLVTDYWSGGVSHGLQQAAEVTGDSALQMANDKARERYGKVLSGSPAEMFEWIIYRIPGSSRKNNHSVGPVSWNSKGISICNVNIRTIASVIVAADATAKQAMGFVNQANPLDSLERKVKRFFNQYPIVLFAVEGAGFYDDIVNLLGKYKINWPSEWETYFWNMMKDSIYEIEIDSILTNSKRSLPDELTYYCALATEAAEEVTRQLSSQQGVDMEKLPERMSAWKNVFDAQAPGIVTSIPA